MTVIAQDVFTIAMTLIDETSEDGTYEGYPVEYKNKAWTIISMLQSELLPPTIPPLSITSNLSVLQVDERTGLSVLPYGLAAHLLIAEDQNRASFFNARYDELKRKRPALIVSITDVYGVKEFEEAVTPIGVPIEGGSFLDPDSGTYDGGEF
jgi:hypothetical protein